VTAPLIGVLLYIANTGDKALGFAALFMMGIGMGLPLLLVGMSAGRWLPKRGPWMEAVKHIFGVLLLGMAAWLVLRLVSYHLPTLVWGLSLLVISFMIAFYLPKRFGREQFCRGFALALAIIALMITYQGIQWTGKSNFAQISAAKSQNNAFILIHSMDDFNKQLASSLLNGKPVMLDFYADWCESCVVMDKRVFAKPDVQGALTRFMVLRIDLSANTAEDQAIMKQFRVIAPPTILFFNSEGQEVSSQRIVGEMNSQEFIERIATFLADGCDKNVHC
jgi:thiol:disulfide interchange protein DsbD